MEVIPAIDLKAGRCVRLFQGDFSQETVFSEDPMGVARGWQEQGATLLHVVDLDGAAAGNPANLAVIEAIVSDLSIPVQVGGGIRSRSTADALLAAGVNRVVIGTAAIENPEMVAGLCQEYGGGRVGGGIRSRSTADALLAAGVNRVVIGTAAIENPEMVAGLCQEYGGGRVVVAVDARDGLVAIKGWTEASRVTALELARQMARLGVPRLLYTDISRDGTMTEPNFSANAELVAKSGLKVQASGGVSSLDHIRQLAQTGAEGVIIGTALYQGTISLAEAIAIAGSG
jgi:phosphoribosylformimino-5-aminoimidazole carboxamide ribotide isomerase